MRISWLSQFKSYKKQVIIFFLQNKKLENEFIENWHIFFNSEIFYPNKGRIYGKITHPNGPFFLYKKNSNAAGVTES